MTIRMKNQTHWLQVRLNLTHLSQLPVLSARLPLQSYSAVLPLKRPFLFFISRSSTICASFLFKLLALQLKNVIYSLPSSPPSLFLRRLHCKGAATVDLASRIARSNDGSHRRTSSNITQFTASDESATVISAIATAIH